MSDFSKISIKVHYSSREIITMNFENVLLMHFWLDVWNRITIGCETSILFLFSRICQQELNTRLVGFLIDKFRMLQGIKVQATENPSGWYFYDIISYKEIS